MNVATLLETRRVQWRELENLCDAMELRGRTDKAGMPEHRGAAGVSRFSTLYRAACADLALADAYQLPPATVTYLHRLVARAHNQLYRANKFEPSRWTDVVFFEAPQLVYSDPCVRIATIVFFGLFALSMYLAAHESLFPNYADQIVGQQALEATEESFDRPFQDASAYYVKKAAWYIRHNTGIGLQCFAYGILIIPCLFTLAYNALVLGATFGYMSREGIDGGDNFFQFVTAHGPFELSAIALAAAGGLRLGVGLFHTRGLTRVDSVRENAKQAIPIMAASAMLFVLAAITEGFLSPSNAPYLVKAAWAILSSGLISFYFVILGFPQGDPQQRANLTAGRYDTLVDHSGGEDASPGGIVHAT
jgi:uncharacterized membrane protein SpoIIM required for sporulation